MKRHWFLSACFGSLAVAIGLIGPAGAAQAQAPAQAPAKSAADRYPEKPIRIIVPFAPGGSVDVLARAVGQKMEEHWGQPVIVENRSGGSGVTARGCVISRGVVWGGVEVGHLLCGGAGRGGVVVMGGVIGW